MTELERAVYAKQEEALRKMAKAGPITCGYCSHAMRCESEQFGVWRCDNCKASLNLSSVARALAAKAVQLGDFFPRKVEAPKEHSKRWMLSGQGLEYLNTCDLNELHKSRALSMRAVNCIEAGRPILSTNLADLLKIKNFGRHSFRELVAFLKSKDGLLCDTFATCPHCGKALR